MKALLRYGINDIRLFYENDVWFLKQFWPMRNSSKQIGVKDQVAGQDQGGIAEEIKSDKS
jgi:hypothetical protein